MKNNMFRKGLVLGIIILFIGVAFQPSVATVQRNKEIITAVIENKDTLNELIEQLSDLPCDCENDDTTQRNYPILCTLLLPFAVIAVILWLATYREGPFINIITELYDRLNCQWFIHPHF